MSGMIVAPQPAAVEVGARVLMKGGNAVDAAVACAFAQGVVDPHMCGIGGYTLLTLYRADATAGGPGRTWYLDAPALAGSRVTAEMWANALLRPNPDGWGYFLKDSPNELGYSSICTPGAVRGLSLMLDRWGSIPWSEALAPAIELAERGFCVDSHLADGWKTPRKYPESLTQLDVILANPEARRIYLKSDGRPYDVGDTLRNRDLAATLQQLGERGPDSFYTGELAGRMASDLATHGSYVTAEDLATYQVTEADPLVGTYRGYRIATSRPPHGGPTLLTILNILEGYDLGSMGHNSPDYIHRVAQAMKAGFADRNPYMADPRSVDVPLEWMISKERAAVWRRRIDAGDPIHVSFSASEPPHTTHVSVADSDGNAVALTHSLGMSSGVITPGLGFMYNNSMVNFHPLPGHRNSIAPGKGRTTGMTPTIVSLNDRPLLVIGAPGATRIITAVAQVIVNVLDFGMSISDAVAAPRFNCQSDLITCHARIPEYVCERVRERHPIQRLPYSHGELALVHAIRIDPRTNRRSGAADAGASGMTLEV